MGASWRVRVLCELPGFVRFLGRKGGASRVRIVEHQVLFDIHPWEKIDKLFCCRMRNKKRRLKSKNKNENRNENKNKDKDKDKGQGQRHPEWLHTMDRVLVPIAIHGCNASKQANPLEYIYMYF